MDGNAGCEKFHAMLIERRRLLCELERLSKISRDRIYESRRTIVRVERICAEPRNARHDGQRK